MTNKQFEKLLRASLIKHGFIGQLKVNMPPQWKRKRRNKGKNDNTDTNKT